MHIYICICMYVMYICVRIYILYYYTYIDIVLIISIHNTLRITKILIRLNVLLFFFFFKFFSLTIFLFHYSISWTILTCYRHKLLLTWIYWGYSDPILKLRDAKLYTPIKHLITSQKMTLTVFRSFFFK